MDSSTTSNKKNLRSLLLTSHLAAHVSNKAPSTPPPPLPTSELRGGNDLIRELENALGQVSHLSSFMTLVQPILQDLEANLSRLLTLNVSRREAVAQYLDRLSGSAQSPAAAMGSMDAASGLRRWIEGPRSASENAALQAYFEEIALILLGQIVLLKAWHDRGLRTWSEDDLKDPNYALHAALKPYVPLDRETWLVAKRSIYSWYKPSEQIQRQIAATLDSWQIAAEGPQFLGTLLSAAKKARPEQLDPRGYDPRFYKAIWESMPAFGIDPMQVGGPIRRNCTLFTPTLRDGALVRTGPVSTNWIALENSCFQLILAELMQLWWGQAAPPLWSSGNGLEAHSRDQLTLCLSSPKPSLLTRIAEIESCDAAFVLEENSVRAQGPQNRAARGTESMRFREQLEGLSYFKKLRAAGTTLGDLQACVALSKLRPGGLLWWAREEPLESRDGMETLGFLLERAKLVCEWNFSGVAHSLPTSARVSSLFPKYLYLFVREGSLEERLSHRPMRVSVQGQLRSHIELPLLFEDALQSTRKTILPRGQWQFQMQSSPTTQKEWSERWPDPAKEETIRSLERLRESSLPLANVTTIRLAPEGDAARNHAWTVNSSMQGLWIQATHSAEGRKLKAMPLPHAPDEAHGPGFIILLSDENNSAPLRAYLESRTVHEWLEHHCERRGEKWVLSEPRVRWIPVPKTLLASLGMVEAGAAEKTFAAPLPGEWERIASQLAQNPSAVKEAVQALIVRGRGEPATQSIVTEIFVRASRMLDSLRSSQRPLLELVGPRGEIRWTKLLDILPQTEMTAVSMHPMVSLIGSLPHHLPIGHIAPTRAPGPGFLFATDSGLSLKLLSDAPLLLEILGAQLEGVANATWSELIQHLRLPRKLELAQTTASDILRSHGEQSKRIEHLAELVELLSACQLF